MKLVEWKCDGRTYCEVFGLEDKSQYSCKLEHWTVLLRGEMGDNSTYEGEFF